MIIEHLSLQSQVDAWGMDGEVVKIIMPSIDKVMELVSESEKKHKARLGNIIMKQLALQFYTFPCNVHFHGCFKLVPFVDAKTVNGQRVATESLTWRMF